MEKMSTELNVQPLSLKARFNDLAKNLFIPAFSNLWNECVSKSRPISENFRILVQRERYEQLQNFSIFGPTISDQLHCTAGFSWKSLCWQNLKAWDPISHEVVFVNMRLHWWCIHEFWHISILGLSMHWSQILNTDWRGLKWEYVFWIIRQRK